VASLFIPIYIVALLTPWHSKLQDCTDKLIKRNQEWKLWTGTTYCFVVSLCVLILISILDPNMLTSHSWYTLPMAAATIAMVMLIQDLSAAWQ
jgi:hypothetical protein